MVANGAGKRNLVVLGHNPRETPQEGKGKRVIQHHIEEGMFLRHRRAPNPARGSILYIHGLGESGLGFEDLIQDPRLDRWHHLVPDLPGYGRSAWTAAPLGLEDQADLLGRWLETRGDGPVVVVGHSMGGVVGLRLCERFPRAVRAFFNVEGNVSSHDCGFSRKVGGHSLEGLVAGGLDSILEGIYHAGREDLPLRGYYASMRLCDPRLLHRNSLELVALSTEEQLAARQAALSIPHAYVLGSPRGTGAHSQALLTAAGVPWNAIEDAGHWPFLDQSDAFLDRLVHFLGA
jgi:pimeloyl-ACP methyl ester carboxylesterase